MTHHLLKRLLFAATLSGICFFSACRKDYTGIEDQSPQFAKAEQNRKSRKYADALKNYEEFLAEFPKSGKAHLRIAELCRDNLREPIMAIYHFRKYQELSNLSQEDKRNVGGFIRSCKQSQYESFTEEFGPPTAEVAEIERLKGAISQRDNELSVLRQKMKEYIEANAKLKKQNEELSRRGGSGRATQTGSNGNSGTAVTGGNAASGADAEAVPAGGTTYKVVAGDTLSKISKKMYGSKNHVDKIRKANAGKLGPKDRINVGQTLIIPPK